MNKHISTLIHPINQTLRDAAEISIDALISEIKENPGVIKDIPIVKWLATGCDIYNNIQTATFIRKYSAFIGYVNDEPDDSIYLDKNLLQLLGDENEIIKLVDKTIIALDRYQNEMKAGVLGALFKETFKEQRFSIKEYNLLMFTIELIHPYNGFDCLKDFYRYRIETNEASDDSKRREIWEKYCTMDYSPLATTCLINLPKGGSQMGDLGGASINDLGFKFYKFVVSKVDRV